MKHFKCIILTIAVTEGNTYYTTEINAVTGKSQLLYTVFLNADFKLNILRPRFNVPLQQNNWPPHENWSRTAPGY